MITEQTYRESVNNNQLSMEICYEYYQIHNKNLSLQLSIAEFVQFFPQWLMVNSARQQNVIQKVRSYFDNKFSKNS
jgi:hypothetical protein